VTGVRVVGITKSNHNLFIIYPPGLGGNHLANIISMDDNYLQRSELADYNNNQRDAHFSKIKNLKLDVIKENIDILKKGNNVLCGHCGEYLWFKDDPFFNSDLFKNKKFCVINPPKSINSLAYQRLIKVLPVYESPYFFQECSTLYSIKYLSKLFDESDWFFVDSELLFTDDVNLLLDDLKLQGLIKNFNHDVVTSMHDTWITSIKKKCGE